MKKNILIGIFFIFTILFGLNYILFNKNVATTQQKNDYLYPIEVNRKYGYINKQGKEIVKPQYGSAGEFSEGLAPVCNNGKCGYLDLSGNEVVPFKFDEAYEFSEGLARISIHNKYGFINKVGEIIINPQFDNVENFIDGRALVRLNENGKYGYIDSKSDFVIKPIYNEAQSFSEGLALVLTGYSKENYPNYGFIDKNGKLIINLGLGGGLIEPKFHNGLSPNFESQYPGCRYIDKTGKIVLDPEKKGFEPVPYNEGCPYFSDGLLMVFYDKERNIGFIDKENNLKVKTNQKWNWGDLPPINDFNDGLASFFVGNNWETGKWGFIDKTGKIIIKPIFDEAESFYNGLAYVKTADLEGYINKQGNFIWSREKEKETADDF